MNVSGASIQRPQRIRNWTIEKRMSLSVTETTVNNCVLGIVQPFCNPFTTSSVYGSIRNTDRLLKERDRYS